MDELTDERIDELLDLLGYTDRWPGGTVDSLVSALYELRSRRAAGDEANGLLDALDTLRECDLYAPDHTSEWTWSEKPGVLFNGIRSIARALLAGQRDAAAEIAPTPAPEGE
jgi:hypothetical protein